MYKKCTKCGRMLPQDDLHLFELPYTLDRNQEDNAWVRIITGLCYDCSYDVAKIVKEYI